MEEKGVGGRLPASPCLFLFLSSFKLSPVATRGQVGTEDQPTRFKVEMLPA